MKKWVSPRRLKELFHFIQSPFFDGFNGHELDHVALGYYDTEPRINSDEVESWKWMSIDAVKQICSCV
jgi:isopentenyl-diphosphate delta-isomerase